MEKRLFRSRMNKMLGGVCGGLGDYFNIDPVLIRVIFVAGTFVTGIGLLAYILLWIIVPFEPVVTTNPADFDQTIPPAGQQPVHQARKSSGGAIFGTILILIGLIFLADNFIPFFRFWDFWPIVLIALGAGLLLKAKE
jgi:phage shock protein PspC (stress-responsive transcriptional regulator)